MSIILYMDLINSVAKNQWSDEAVTDVLAK